MGQETSSFPPDLSIQAEAFKGHFNAKLENMKAISRKFRDISKNIKMLCDARTAARASAGIGLGSVVVGVILAPLTLGLSLVITAGAVASAAVLAAGVSGAVYRFTEENRIENGKFAKLGKDFKMEINEQIDCLKEMASTEFSESHSAIQIQATQCIIDAAIFERYFERADALSELFEEQKTPDEKKEFRDKVVKLPKLCEMTIRSFQRMNDLLVRLHSEMGSI